MFISWWIIAFVVVGVLYFIGDMSKRQEALVARVKVLDERNRLQSAALEKYQEYVKEETTRAWNIRMGLRHTLGNGSNPVVLKRLEEYAFGGGDVQLEPFDWKDPV